MLGMRNKAPLPLPDRSYDVNDYSGYKLCVFIETNTEGVGAARSERTGAGRRATDETGVRHVKKLK